MRFFAAALIFFGVAASHAQTPTVPHKIRFAGMSLTILDDARREIQKDVDALTMHAGYFDMKVERAKTYFPIIEKIFAEENLPDDFKYLCLQESALVSDAVSVSDAVGFWQFKDFTAKEMGLRVDKDVDERMNIVSASRGAARYLKQSNAYFNNWLIALQAYQMGTGGVRRLLGEKYNGDNQMVISSETYWYVKKYLAHKVAFESAYQGSPKTKVVLYEATDRSIKDIAGEVLVDEDVLKEFNKWAKRGMVPNDKSYPVIVPVSNSLQDFNNLVINSKKAGKAIASTKQKKELVTYTQINGIEAVLAGEGETVSTLAKRCGLDVSKFIRYNDISIDDGLNSGRFYFLKKKKKKNDMPVYRTKLGDDLWTVSQQFGVRLRSLKKLNPEVNTALLIAGTSIRLNPSGVIEQSVLPEPDVVAELSQDTFVWVIEPPQKKESSSQFIKYDSLERKLLVSTVNKDSVIDHVVSAGETLYSISQKYSVGVSQIIEFNQLMASDTLKPGQLIRIQNHKPEANNDSLLAVAQKEKETFVYTVKSSDTLYGISRQFGATIKEVMDWNNKSDLTITVGEKLTIQKR